MIKKIAAAATAGTIAWAGISGIDNTSRDDSGKITTAGDLGAFVTKVGDCLNGLPTGQTGSIDVIKGVPCSEGHHWQVVHKGNLDLGEFNVDAVAKGARELCKPVYDNLFYGLSESKYNEYQNSEGNSLQPTSESWAHDDRVVDCLVGSDSETYFTSILD